MGIRVYTESVCDRCGERKMEPDRDGETAMGWERYRQLRATASDLLLCPQCYAEFQDFLRGRRGDG